MSSHTRAHAYAFVLSTCLPVVPGSRAARSAPCPHFRCVACESLSRSPRGRLCGRARLLARELMHARHQTALTYRRPLRRPQDV